MMGSVEKLFLAATPRGWVISVCKFVIGPLLRVYYRIKRVRVFGATVTSRGKRIVFVANHVDRRDAALAFYLSKVLRDSFYFLSNREQLQEGTLYTWLLRSVGVYSVARGLVDISSIKYTTRLLSGEEPNRLFLFPEGGAFSRNDSVFPFLIQPFELILRANRQAKEIAIVPVAIRYEYENVDKDIAASIQHLEIAVGLPGRSGQADYVNRLLAIGNSVVHSFDRVFDIELPAYETEVHEKGLRIKQHLVDSLSAHLTLLGGDDSARSEDENARDVLNKLYGRQSLARTDEDLAPRTEYERRLRKEIFDKMSRVFEEAKRLENWVGLERDYFRENVTTERMVDAIIRLEREVFGDVRWSAERTAVLKLGDEINVSEFSDAALLTDHCRSEIMSMLRG
jgi:hypothetical protein